MQRLATLDRAGAADAPRAGEIGPVRREIVFEPVEEPLPVEAPPAPEPAREPVRQAA